MRAKNMQSLTDDVKSEHPGVVIYGIGDAAHRLSISDHNEDDTSGSKAAQSDKDTTKEHRAIDIMLGKAFTKADADRLVAALLADPAARARIWYIIWNGYQWSRSNGWVKTKYTKKDQHTDHIHISGWAADDENSAPWPAVNGKSMEGVSALFCKLNDTGANVKYLQYRLSNLGFSVTADSSYGAKTAAALAAAVKSHNGSVTNGQTYGPEQMIYLDVLWGKKYGGQPGLPGKDGKDGRDGKDGEPGAPGKPGELILPTEFVFRGSVEPAN